MSEIYVKISKLPGRPFEVCLNGERTVKKALEIGEMTVDGETEVRLNGEPTTMDAALVEGDRISLTKKVKGA